MKSAERTVRSALFLSSVSSQILDLNVRGNRRRSDQPAHGMVRPFPSGMKRPTPGKKVEITHQVGHLGEKPGKNQG